MKRQGRSFSTDFKHEAACLVVDQGYSISEASRSLGAGETAFRRRVQQLKLERGGGTPVSKALTVEQKRIQELEARVNRLEREKTILKKATAFFLRPGSMRLNLRVIVPGCAWHNKFRTKPRLSIYAR